MENTRQTLAKSLLGSESHVSSTHGSVGIESGDVGTSSKSTTKRKVKLYTASVLIVVFHIFMVASSTGLLMCALWPLCSHLDGNHIHLGFLVAMHNLSKFMFATKMSELTEKYKHRFTLITGSMFGILGSFLWALSPLLGGLPMLYIAQFVLGVFCATLGTARAFIVEQTRPNRRTHVLGRVTTLEFSGHYVTPLFGALLIALGDQMSDFMKFALPAFVLCAMCGVLLFYLVNDFVDIRPEDEMTEDDYNTTKVVDTTTNAIIYSGKQDIERSGENTAPYAPPEVVNTVEPFTPSSPTSPAGVTTVTLNSPSPTLTSASQPTPTTIISNVSPTAPGRMGVSVYQVVLVLNFTIRGCLAAYSTLSAELILNDFDQSFYVLGGLLSGAGALGALQMLNLKALWTSHFSDPMLFLIGCAVLGCAQVFVVNWEPTENPELWQFSVALYAVMALGFPVAISAALGSFSQLQRVGHQSAHHAHLIMVEATANIIIPILSGVMEQTVRKFTTFSFVMFMMAGSIILVMVQYDSLMKLSERAANATEFVMLDNVYVRYTLIVLATFLVLAGLATFMVSILGGRV